jgi:hypothetical protein
MSAFGGKADVRNVRYSPESRHRKTLLSCPLCAKSRHMQCSKNDRFSITSSAVASPPTATSIFDLAKRYSQ